MLHLMLAASAIAAPPPSDDELEREERLELEALEAADAPRSRKERQGPIVAYELAFRGRYLSIPQGLMDSWFHSSSDAGWPIDTDRPRVQAGTWGLDLSLYNKKNSVAVIYAEVARSFTAEGYWDGREEGEQFLDNGRWVRPARFLGAVILGANGRYDAVLVPSSQTRGVFSMGLQVGGGLGLAILVGNMDYWKIDPATGVPAYVSKDLIAPYERLLPSPIWPAVDLDLSLRFTFAERVTLRLEGGLHGALYYGASLGARF